MAERDPAIAGAAAQILTLINSRPNSPSQSEIETVIADAVHIVPATSLTWDPIVLEVVAAVDAWEEAVSPDGPEEAAAVEAARKHLKEIARRLWCRKPGSWADIVARAVVLERIDDVTGDLAYDDRSAEATLLGAATYSFEDGTEQPSPSLHADIATATVEHQAASAIDDERRCEDAEDRLQALPNCQNHRSCAPSVMLSRGRG